MTYLDPNTDPRNVTDEFKGMETENIRDIVRSRTFPYAAAMVNWENDFNFSGMVRTANAMGCRKIYYVAPKRKWDKRGAQGTYNYTDVEYCASEEELFDRLEEDNWQPIAIEQSGRSAPLWVFDIHERMCFVFGAESTGLTPEAIEKCDKAVFIPQYGSTRSLNAAVASGIVLAKAAETFSGAL